MTLTAILEICAAIYSLAVLMELFLRKRWLWFIMHILALIAAMALALLVSAETGRVAFGNTTSPLSTVGIMFLAIILGITARYVFYLQKGQFSWLDFLKPISISPIVLLPLIGSVQTTGEINDMQVISFAVLAFQNGFFWQAVLGTAKPAGQSAPGATTASHV